MIVRVRSYIHNFILHFRLYAPAPEELGIGLVNAGGEIDPDDLRPVSLFSNCLLT